ncbi:MAG TPA: FtsQ-type POTRA domain-containing protein [Candidatus Kapabacteria bacterium]|nr:FtsQ-type POTRA domain-containing protein [Candidatus Kapabacteria bacterium]
MKFTIQPTERKEFVNLPARAVEREPDDFVRELRNRSAEPEREMLGQPDERSSSAPPRAETPSDTPQRDRLATFLVGVDEPESEASYDETAENGNDFDENDFDDNEFDAPEALWKRSKWPAAIFLTALAVLGTLWYFASRSDSDLMLANVKIEGADLLSNREVLALAAIDRSIPFYKIALKPIELRLLKHSLIQSAHVRRELDPATLVLTIQERQPVAFLRSDSNGEAFIIDRDGLLLRPKLIAGLRDPVRLLQVPLLSGVSEHDTAGYQAMAKMVMMIAALDSGALANSIGELHRTPTGDYVIYTSATQTPIFIGSPFEHAFRTALEEQAGTVPKYPEPLFDRQLELLARAWKPNLQHEILAGHTLYVDARFSGQIVLKQKSPIGPNANSLAMAPSLHTNNAHYATNAIQQRTGSRPAN